MSVVRRTRALIDRGRSNVVQYIPTGIEKLDEHTDGITQGTYILIGAETSVGKTSLARDKYLHTPYEHYKRINDPARLDVYFADMSLEIIPEINQASAYTRKLFMDYQRVIPAKKILRGLSDDDNRLVASMEEYFEEFHRKCLIVDNVTPNKFHDTLMEIAKLHGRFSREAPIISECGDWTPNNPNLYIEIMLDAVNLGEMDSGHTTIKSTIDRISRIAVWFRNKCKFIIIVIQQLNADIATWQRIKWGSLTPKVIDFEDSKRTTKDADIILGLYDPIRHIKEEQTMFRGYDMSIMKSWYRSLHILKNRRGENNKVIDLKFDGALGLFSQLPDPAYMDENEYVKATRH